MLKEENITIKQRVVKQANARDVPTMQRKEEYSVRHGAKVNMCGHEGCIPTNSQAERGL